MRFSEDRIEKLACSDGVLRDIHIWEHEKPRAVYLTVHGLMDHGGNYLNAGLYMKAHGFALVAFDQHGHDRKRKAHVPRFEVFLDDLQLMLDWVRDHYSKLPIFIMGHSMGGLIVTHFGLRSFKEDPLVKGFILSAPAYENKLKTSKFVIALARILSRITPRNTVPVEDLRLHVTRDKNEYKRMREDERDGIQATKMSARLGAEFIRAQEWVPDHLAGWKYPLLVIVPGKDRLIDSDVTRKLIAHIGEGVVTERFYPENHHESFNDLNREEVFAHILEWCEPRIV